MLSFKLGDFFFINILKRIFSLGMTSFMDWNQCILHFFDGVMFSNIENPGILIPLKIKARTSRFWLKKKNIQRTRGYDLLYLQNLSFVDIVNQIKWVIHLGEETCNIGMLTPFSKNKNDIIMMAFLHIYHNLDQALYCVCFGFCIIHYWNSNKSYGILDVSPNEL